jgi:hypothetical protein
VQKSRRNSPTENQENLEIDRISTNSFLILLAVGKEVHSNWKGSLNHSHRRELFTERFPIVLNRAKDFSLARTRQRAWSINWEFGRVADLLDDQSQILRVNPLPSEHPVRCFSIGSTASATMTNFKADFEESIIRRDDE